MFCDKCYERKVKTKMKVDIRSWIGLSRKKEEEILQVTFKQIHEETAKRRKEGGLRRKKVPSRGTAWV